MAMTDRSADKQKKNKKIHDNGPRWSRVVTSDFNSVLPPPGAAPVHNYNTDVSGVANLRIPITRISWKFGKS